MLTLYFSSRFVLQFKVLYDKIDNFISNFQVSIYTDLFLKTFLKEKLPSAPGTGLFGFDREIGEREEGNSGGMEFRPIRLFSIRPAT